MKYCIACERNVTPTKKFNGVVFVLLVLFMIIPAFIYLFYYMSKSKRCPICKGTAFEKVNAHKRLNS